MGGGGGAPILHVCGGGVWLGVLKKRHGLEGGGAKNFNVVGVK